MRLRLVKLCSAYILSIIGQFNITLYWTANYTEWVQKSMTHCERSLYFIGSWAQSYNSMGHYLIKLLFELQWCCQVVHSCTLYKHVIQCSLCTALFPGAPSSKSTERRAPVFAWVSLSDLRPGRHQDNKSFPTAPLSKKEVVKQDETMWSKQDQKSDN